MKKTILMVIIFLFIISLLSTMVIGAELIINDSSTGVLADTYVKGNFEDSNFGLEGDLRIMDRSDRIRRIYIMFNITGIERKSIITDALLYLFLNTTQQTSNRNIVAHHALNYTWIETNLTYASQLCGTTRGKVTGLCNVTAEDNITVGTESKWYIWNVTSALKREYVDLTTNNISFVLRESFEDLATQGNPLHIFISRNSTNTSITPYLNITFIDDNQPPSLLLIFNDTSLVQNDGFNVSVNISDSSGLSHCQISINQTSNSIEFFNFTLSGAGNDRCSQNFTIKNLVDVINISVLVNDTSNNIVRISQLIDTSDQTIPTINNFNFSLLTIVDGNRINWTVNASDGDSNLKKIEFNFTNPDSVSASRSNPAFFTLPSVNDYILNYTFFSGSETSVVGIWNLTSVEVVDLQENRVVVYPNITFEVTAVPSEGPAPGGGGGGGTLIIQSIINETIIISEIICNFNGVCELEIGEDFVNCGNEKSIFDAGGDCGFELGTLGSAFRNQLKFGLVSKTLFILFLLSVGTLAFLPKERIDKIKRNIKNIKLQKQLNKLRFNKA